MLTGYSDEAGLLTVVRILKPFSTVLDGESPFYGTEAYAQEACIRGVPPKNKKAAQCAASKGGGPTRTRTVDQRIMSWLETL